MASETTNQAATSRPIGHRSRRDVDPNGHGRPFRQTLHGRRQAALHHRGGVDAAGQLPQLVEGRVQLRRE